MNQKITSHIVKGLIIALILIVLSITIYLTGQMANQSLGNLAFLILLAGIIYSCILFARQSEGNVTFGNVFAHGFKTTAVVVVIQFIYTILAIKVLFPDMVDVAMDAARKQLEQAGKLSDEQIEQSMGMMKKLFFPFAIGGMVLMYGIIGAVASAIGAAVAKKNPNASSPFNQQKTL